MSLLRKRLIRYIHTPTTNNTTKILQRYNESSNNYILEKWLKKCEEEDDKITKQMFDRNVKQQNKDWEKEFDLTCFINE